MPITTDTEIPIKLTAGEITELSGILNGVVISGVVEAVAAALRQQRTAQPLLGKIMSQALEFEQRFGVRPDGAAAAPMTTNGPVVQPDVQDR